MGKELDLDYVVHGSLRAPRGLVELGRNTNFRVTDLRARVQFVPTCPLLVEPLRVRILRPVRLWMMAPEEFGIAVINALFDTAVRTRT